MTLMSLCGKIMGGMDTKVISINEDNIDIRLMEEAGDIIRSGGLVAFPTETVYGLGGDALNPMSSRKIYAAKGRPSDNPLIVHVADMESVESIVTSVPDKARVLADKFWPGPLTIIMNKSDKVPYETTGGLDTVAIRMPVHKTALAFIRASGGYIAAPSANLSGRPSPTAVRYVKEDMSGRIEMIIDGGDVPIGLESTIIDLSGDVPMLLRPGFITLRMLEDAIGHVETDPTIMSGDCKERPKAPGMKYRHYAPKGDLVIVDGARDAVIDHINAHASEEAGSGGKVGIIATDETEGLYRTGTVKSVGHRQDESMIAHRLYTILREFDDEGVTKIFSESFDSDGMGQAIMNRLLKAAGHQVIKV